MKNCEYKLILLIKKILSTNFPNFIIFVESFQWMILGIKNSSNFAKKSCLILIKQYLIAMIMNNYFIRQ